LSCGRCRGRRNHRIRSGEGPACGFRLIYHVTDYLSECKAIIFGVDVTQLKTALAEYFKDQGLTEIKEPTMDLVLGKGGELWGFALCPDREEGMAYLGAFEAAMQKMVDAHQANADMKLGLGIAFGSTAAGNHPSYRRALKKYSNSIVFEDLGLRLFLVQAGGEVMELPPSGANLFLRDLDRWIAARK
jgi:hypothetical protein